VTRWRRDLPRGDRLLWDDELWHALATRGVRLARETGARRSAAGAARIEWGMSNATERGEGSAVSGGFWLTALLHNGHGQYAEALTAARQACEH
jgi:hypothetical protein